AEQLKNGMKDMGEEQRLAALKTIFGADAARAANVLYQEGAAGLQKYIDMVSKSGVAQQVAAAKLNNAKGDLEKLKGAISDVLIGAGENADGMIRPLIQNVEKLVSAFGSLPSGVQSSIVQLAAFGSAGLLAGAGAIKVVNTIRGMSSAISAGAGAFRTWATMGNSSMSVLQGLTTRARNAGTAFREMGTRAKVGVGLAGAALTAVALAASTSGTDLENAGRQSSQLALDLEKVGKSGSGLDDIFKDMQIAMDSDRSETFADALGYVGKNSSAAYDGISSFTGGLGKFVGVGKGATNETEAVKERLKGVGDELGKMVSDGKGTEAAAIFSKIATEAEKQGVSTEYLMRLMPGYSDAMNRASQAGEKNAEATKQSALEAVKAGAATDEQKKSVDDLADSYKNLNNLLLQQRGGARGYQAAIDAATDALKENGRTLDITTEAGRKNQEALDGIASQAGEWASSVLKATGDQQQANAILADGREQYIRTAQAMGMTKEQAERLADQLIKIDGQNTVDVKVNGVEAAIYGVNSLGEQVIRLKGTSLEIPASVENGPQVLQMMAAIKDLRLSEDGKTMTIKASALTAEAKAALDQVPGVTKNKDGSVTVQVSSLNDKVVTDALGKLLNVARTADGQIVHIPASTNAPQIKAVIEQLHGAAVTFNGTKMVVKTSAPMAESDKKKLKDLAGTAIQFNGTTMTIDSKALTAQALADIAAVLAAAKDKTNTITTVHRVINESVGNNQRAAAADRRDTSARGNVFLGAGAPMAFARGGVREAHEPQIARPTPGRVRVWAEPETQGEAYIPFANDGRRGRAKSITEYVARRFGGSVTWHADGSADDWTPDMSGIMAYAASLKVDPSAVTEQRKKVADQNTALNKAIRDLRAARAGVRGKSGAARVKAENAVATAIERQAKAQRDLNDGRAKLSQMSAGASADTTTRFMMGTTSQNGITQRFLNNIERIRKRGFPRLARSLLEQGDSDAQAIAQTLSGGALSRLKSAQAGLDTSDKLADRKARMLDDLKGIGTGEVADQARAQANAQLIAMQAANQRIAWASGPTTARLEARLDVLADAIRSQPAPIVQASPVKVITQLDSRPIAESTFGHGARESQWGSVLPGAEGGW
ncbi:phage tail tape measure protein, partial [Dermacoccus nishinomiyaensis]|uniref:phage tail tape measure protein n=1 Tax=Dermacoccus nishinomiyaensis TaxID=1274 RepID=UPI00248E1B60